MKTLTHATLTALALVTAAPLLAEEPKDRMLSAEQVAGEVDVAESAYAAIHPGYTRYTNAESMSAAWQAIRDDARASGTMSVGDLYLAIQLALTEIRCDHTKAELPKALRDAREGQPLYLPFRWQWIDGQGLIEFAGADTGLSRGDRIVSVDGRPLSDLAETVARYLPVDGYTEWSRRNGISQSSEFMGGALDHFGALLWDVPSVAQLQIEDLAGETRAVNVPRIDHASWVALGDQLGIARNFKDAVTFERIGEDAALLRVDTFVNYRDTVAPEMLYTPVFSAIAQEARSTLILDLRKNGGGSDDASRGLVSYLLGSAKVLKKEYRVATLDHSPWQDMLSTWDSRAINPDPRAFIANDDGTYTLRDGIMEGSQPVIPADNAFGGRLILLTSDDNSSGSTNLLAALADRLDTVTVGEPTGGSAEGPTAGVIVFLTLPETGIRLRIPLFLQLNNVATFEQGLGITPQISQPMTAADFRFGRDPALEAAKAMAAEPESRNAEAAMPIISIADFAPVFGDGWAGQL